MRWTNVAKTNLHQYHSFSVSIVLHPCKPSFIHCFFFRILTCIFQKILSAPSNPDFPFFSIHLLFFNFFKLYSMFVLLTHFCIQVTLIQHPFILDSISTCTHLLHKQMQDLHQSIFHLTFSTLTSIKNIAQINMSFPLSNNIYSLR